MKRKEEAKESGVNGMHLKNHQIFARMKVIRVQVTESVWCEGNKNRHQKF